MEDAIRALDNQGWETTEGENDTHWALLRG
jgi:hypothetical protein